MEMLKLAFASTSQLS